MRAAPSLPSSNRATVLLVDDEAPIRRSLGPYLERSGYRVHLASDGVEALEVLGRHRIDIVVTDVLMPRLDGRELVRRVRSGGTWTPIILLTQVDAPTSGSPPWTTARTTTCPSPSTPPSSPPGSGRSCAAPRAAPSP